MPSCSASVLPGWGRGEEGRGAGLIWGQVALRIRHERRAPDRKGDSHLPLSGEVAVTGGDAHEEGVVFHEDGGVAEDGDVGVLGRGVHLGEDLLGERLLNS